MPINRELIAFEGPSGDDFYIIDDNHSVTDVLNHLVNEVGFDEVQSVLSMIVRDAVRNGTYEENR